MKKIIAAALSLLLILTLFSACKNREGTDPTAAGQSTNDGDGDVCSIVTTIFPVYDWVRNLLGAHKDQVNLRMLLDTGVDLHNYQPTMDDMMEISNCDLFIYVGGESDGWVDDALASAANKEMQVVNLLESLGDKVKEEEVKEGMEADHDHAHEHEEIEAEDIKDRTLAEFSGTWKSLLPMLNAGELDAYAAHEAEEDGSTVEDAKKELAENWECDAVTVKIDGSKIAFTYADGTTAEADYAYAGYTTIAAEDGDIASVRYQFSTEAENAPKYVQLSDHGHEPAEEVEHFHIYFGDESFDALTESESNPFFVASDMDAEEVTEELTGGHEHHGEEEAEMDEHVWLSLKNASLLCEAIAEKLKAILPEAKDDIEANKKAYLAQLDALDKEYQTAADAAVRTLLFADRFPFRYLTDDYGLDYFAAFVGCSAETEASLETIRFLAEKTDALGLRCVFTIEGSDGRIAEAVINSTQAKDQEILVMNSLQSVTAVDVENGADYLAAMRENLTALKTALG